METIIQSITNILNALGDGVFLIAIFLVFIGILGQWAMYTKAKEPGVSCLVPVWNIIVFLRIIGRPAWHMVFFLVPIYNIYFVIKVYVELCQSFGRTNLSDYLTCIVFNGLYVVYLGLGPAEYQRPVYGKEPAGVMQGEAAMA